MLYILLSTKSFLFFLFTFGALQASIPVLVVRLTWTVSTPPHLPSWCAQEQLTCVCTQLLTWGVLRYFNWHNIKSNLTISMCPNYFVCNLDNWIWKDWIKLTAGTGYIMLSTMPHIRKYRFCGLWFVFANVTIFALRRFINTAYQATVVDVLVVVRLAQF